MPIEMSKKEEHYWNSLDTPILSHTKSCLCPDCKIRRVKKKYNIKEKSRVEEAEARKKILEQLESLGVYTQGEKVEKQDNYEYDKGKPDNQSSDMRQNERLVEEANQRKIEDQLKSLGFWP